MKAIKTTLILLLCHSLLVQPCLLLAQPPRGQGVRVKVNDGPEVALYEASYALVIGVSDYINGWPRLPGVNDDVPAVKVVLEKHGFQVTTVMNPTRQQFDAAVRDFVTRYGQRREHRLLVYFAGHGHTLLTNDQQRELGYIVPSDAASAAHAGEFKRLAISMSEIHNYAEQLEAIHALFVFDSCFSGSIFKSRSSGSVPEAITDKILRPVRQFITAGSAAQTVPDRSYFRRAFVAALEGAADDNRDGFITGTELGEYLHREVTGLTKRAQTPQHGKIFNPDLNEGDLVFVAPKRGKVTLGESSLTPDYADEQASWNRINNSTNPQDFRNYLDTYGEQGAHAPMAKVKLREIENADTAGGGSSANYKDRLKQITEEFSAQKSDDAILHLEKLVQVDPKQPGAYEYLGLLYNEKKEYAKASAAMVQAIKLGGSATFKILHDSQWRRPSRDRETKRFTFQEARTDWLRISTSQLAIVEFTTANPLVILLPVTLKGVSRILDTSLVNITHTDRLIKIDPISFSLSTPTEAEFARELIQDHILGTKPKTQGEEKTLRVSGEGGTSDGALSLQIASNKDRRESEQVVARLKAAGINDVRIVRAEVPGMGVRFGVQVGRFTNESDASKRASELRAMGLAGDFIVTGYVSH